MPGAHMEITEPRRLYQQLAADLKERIEQERLSGG